MKLFTKLDHSDQLEMDYELVDLVSDLGWFEMRTDPISYFTEVAGTSYGNRFKNLRTIKKDDAVILMRQPQNPHDSNAVKVLSLEYQELGYLPKEIAVSVSTTLDLLGSEQKATVFEVAGLNNERFKPRLTISFHLPNVAWLQNDRNLPEAQTPVLRSFNEVCSGHLGIDEKGRFFVMERTHKYVIVYYENQEESKFHSPGLLGRLLPLWPFAQRNTIQSVKDGLREFGLSPSGDVFLDHDILMALERKNGNHHQLTSIRHSAPYRSKVLAMRKMIPADLSTDSFCFGSPPPVFSFSDHQIRHAASRLKKASVLICSGAVIAISFLLLSVLSYTAGGGLFSAFSEKPIFTILMTPILIVLMFIVSLIFWFLSFPIYCLIFKFIDVMVKETLFKKDVKIRDDYLETIKQWDEFLKNEAARYREWENNYTNPCRVYRQAFLAYACMRSYSPWSIDMSGIWLSLKEKYPNRISLGKKTIEGWQKSVWESHNAHTKLYWSSVPNFKGLGNLRFSSFEL